MTGSACHRGASSEAPSLDVARWIGFESTQLYVCLLSAGGEIVEEFASPPDGDGLRGLTRRVGSHGLAVRGVIESMTGARFVHDRLEELGWDVLIADAAKVKGLAPLACKTDPHRRAGAGQVVSSASATGSRRSGCLTRGLV